MDQELVKLLENKPHEERKAIFRKVRRGSAPENLNINREHQIQEKIAEKQRELLKARA